MPKRDMFFSKLKINYFKKRGVKLTGILLKMGANGAEGSTPINFKTMYYEVPL